MSFTFFFGSSVASALALLVNGRHWKSPTFALLAGAFLVYPLGVSVFTTQVNLPRNDYTESWDAQNLPAAWVQVRDQWNRANAIRVLTSGTALVTRTTVQNGQRVYVLSAQQES